MDEGVTLQLEGFQEFNSKLESLKAAVAGRIRNNALRAGAEVVFAEIFAATPHKSGRTAGELQWKITSNAGGAMATIFFDESWPWTALFLEKGTKQNRNMFGEKIKSAVARRRKRNIINIGSTEWRIDPEKHKFMGRAFQAAKPAALAAMLARLSADLDSAATK